MVAEDRALRLRGYEVYRFGSYELQEAGVEQRLDAFFERCAVVGGGVRLSGSGLADQSRAASVYGWPSTAIGKPEYMYPMW